MRLTERFCFCCLPRTSALYQELKSVPGSEAKFERVFGFFKFVSEAKLSYMSFLFRGVGACVGVRGEVLHSSFVSAYSSDWLIICGLKVGVFKMYIDR